MFSFPVLFGDLGGLYEAMETTAMFVIGGLAGSIFKLFRVLNLFRGFGVNHDSKSI